MNEDERPYDPEADAIESYYEAMRAIGALVKSGEPLHEMFIPRQVSAQ